jgi:hypothetical protein
MNRVRQSKKRKANLPKPESDGWILFKRCVFSAIGGTALAAPLFWVLVRDREWSSGMTVMCVLGAGFLALGLFGSRRVVSEADI